MGRKPYKNSQLPPRMRKRVRAWGTYYLYDAGGKPRKEIPLGSDFTEAIKKWAELERANGVMYQNTIFDAINKYLVRVLPTKAKRTQDDNLKELVNIKEFFGNPSPAPLSAIKPVHIKQYLEWRTKDGKGFTRANREKALLSHIFNFARETGMTDIPNPCAGIKGFKEEDREVYVEDDLFEKVYIAATVPVQEAMMLAYLTGQRPADTVKMNERDIKDGCIYVKQNKTGAKLAIRIEGELKTLLARIKERKHGLKIFSTQLIVNESGQDMTQRALSDRFRKARVKAGVPLGDFQFRDLRAKAGTDKYTLEGLDKAKEQLGHTSTRTTEIYIRKRITDKVSPTK